MSHRRGHGQITGPPIPATSGTGPPVPALLSADAYQDTFALDSSVASDPGATSGGVLGVSLQTAAKQIYLICAPQPKGTESLLAAQIGGYLRASSNRRS